jgi:8-amino-7-oxononanoate synthase
VEITGTFLDEALEHELRDLRNRGLERFLRPILRRDGVIVQTDRGQAIDFSSNDYLGLATDRRLIEAASRAASAGATASRLIAGDASEHEQLDVDIAAFLGRDAALTFSTGYAANTGAIPAIVGRGDVIFSDELNHASLIDGCRLSRAEVRVYPHADVGALRQLLATHRAGARRAVVVTDGLFSMDGDVAPLADIVGLSREFDAWTYVDDAHGIGALGDNGRGVAELLGVENEIDILVGTFGKAFGAAGAFVAGSETLRQFLINRARSFIFSTAPSLPQVAAAAEGVRVASSERRTKLRDNVVRMREALGLADGHQIVPVVIGSAEDTMKAGAALADAGFLVGAVRPPTVPDGTSRLRITVSALHTNEQIDALVAALRS